MASLAQVAGQYLFLLVSANEASTTVHGHTSVSIWQHFFAIGHNASSGWVLLLGILWIVAMTYICYRGIEISARFQKVLLSIELVMLVTMSVVALVKVGTGHAPAGHLTPALAWLNPFHIPKFSSFVTGFVYMLFIYWGWDTAVAVNEETANARKTPGQAAVISTMLLLATYALVIFAAQSFAGVGSTGIGLSNSSNQFDDLSVLGSAVFGTSGFGTFLGRMLVLMVLSSAAASTQTTILPTARTTLSMAVYRSIPKAFARVHRRYLTPTVSTLAMGAISIVLYAWWNYQSPNVYVILDAFTGLGAWIAFYYGLTGFACVWYYRKTLRHNARNLWMRGILPLAGALILFAIMIYSIINDWHLPTGYTQWRMPFWPHWDMAGPFVIAVGSGLVGLVAFVLCWIFLPDFFKGRTLNKNTPTLLNEDGMIVGPVDLATAAPPSRPLTCRRLLRRCRTGRPPRGVLCKGGRFAGFVPISVTEPAKRLRLPHRHPHPARSFGRHSGTYSIERVLRRDILG